MADGEKEEKQRFKRGELIRNELPPQWKPAAGKDEELSGFYRGWKLIKPQSAKAPFKIQIFQLDEETTLNVRNPADPDGPPIEEIFDEGELVSTSGKILDRQMSRVPPNTFVWVKYLGKTKVGQGKAHTYQVQLPQGVQPLPEMMDSDAEIK